ncbi:MAG: cardiolipin synthase [Rhodopirellula sp.]|nr:cardiolipin synthase [Rhodopirellula sp.]
MTLTVEIIGPILAAISVVVSLFASGHVVLYKRDCRAAIAWVGLIWLAPVIGTGLYVMLGINRIERRARTLRPGRTVVDQTSSTLEPSSSPHAASFRPHLVQMSKLVRNVTGQELTFGNTVEPLSGEDETYPAMLAAIHSARRTIGLSTYIFDADDVGMEFAKALAAAVKRGVEVRVLIDAVGAEYALSSVVSLLEEFQVPVRTFNPPLISWRFRYANLRNHRKILTIDGSTSFTGGMNIRGGCVTSKKSTVVVDDLHFLLSGPIVKHVQDTFAADWLFAADESLTGEGWYPILNDTGNCIARGIADGPDEQLDQLRLTLLGACQCAERSLKIITPYFLPDASLINALNVAALRGVSVEILIPQRGNEKLVQWACEAQLWQLVDRGCQIRRTHPPFDHTKLLIVDDDWILMGSANWDPRSLRLNFEFGIECYNQSLAVKLLSIFEAKRTASDLVTMTELQSRSLLIRLRNGVVRLASPFL